MTPTPKEAAQLILGKYSDDLFEAGHIISKPMIKQIAILHCNGIIDELEMVEQRNTSHYNLFSCYDEIEHYKNIIQEIEKL